MLEQILRTKREELPRLRRRSLPAPPPLRPVALARTAGGPLRLIAEIKLRSPSAGPLSRTLGVGARAAAYERAGASMISVLCDATYFDGAYSHLGEARGSTSLPLLCKEFVVDEAQLDAARAYGADAVLLIARCVTPARLAALLAGALERGLTPLTEVYTPEEVPIAVDAGAQLIGVNARDLETMVLDAERAKRTLAALPQHVTRAHLSGLRAPAQVAEVAQSGIDAALIGECLMREDDPGPLLERLVQAGRL